MRRFVLIVTVLTAVILGAVFNGLGAQQVTPATNAPVVDQAGIALPPPPTGTSLVGELVCTACYRARGPLLGGTGAGHANCAMICAQKGQRLSLVTPNGDVYVVTGPLADANNARLIQMVNQTVVLTGVVTVVDVNALASLITGIGSVIAGTDGRRPSGTEEGIVGKFTIRKDDFREGDFVQGTVKIMLAMSVASAPKLMP